MVTFHFQLIAIQFQFLFALIWFWRIDLNSSNKASSFFPRVPFWYSMIPTAANKSSKKAWSMKVSQGYWPLVTLTGNYLMLIHTLTTRICIIFSHWKIVSVTVNLFTMIRCEDTLVYALKFDSIIKTYSIKVFFLKWKKEIMRKNSI